MHAKRLILASWLSLPCTRASLTLLGIALFFLVGSSAAQPPATKKVLELFSSSDRNDESWNLVENEVRARVPGRITFYRAYLEDSRLGDAAYRESQIEVLRNTYADLKLDLVMTAFTPELQFSLQYRDRLFPDVPIVFAAISTRELGELNIPPGVTGLTVPVGIKETIDLALQLQPDANTVAVIASPSTTGRYWLAASHAELLRHQNRVKEIDLIGPPSEQLLEQVAGLPAHTIVLFELGPEDSSRPAFGIYDLLPAIAQRFPTYSPWPSLCLNYGCIGGAYEDARKENLSVGEIASRVLLGEQPENIPILHSADLQVRVDSRAIRKWHIPESALPLDAQVLYREPSFWQHYKRYAIAACAVIAVQFVLIVGLLWQRARRRRAQAVLRESEKRFRVMADNTPSLIWMCDAAGNITYLNEQRIAFTGSDPNVGFGDAWTPVVYKDDLKKVLDIFSAGVKSHERFSMEYRLRRQDGAYRWMFDVAAPRVNGDGSFAGFIGSAVDVTDQKMAQDALEKVSGQLIEAQEKERSRLARELHDDICQRLAILSLKIENVNKLGVGGKVSIADQLEKIRQECSELNSDVQSLSHELHPSILDNLGLVTAVKSFCREVSEQNGVVVEFMSDDIPSSLPREISLSLFRVIQEAVHNAIKYSGEKHFEVRLQANNTDVELEVIDRGAGFDAARTSGRTGLGLVSMAERIHQVNGTFKIVSQQHFGTRIQARVPLK